MSKVIVVTGAGGVLCSTLAKALAKEGHKIAVLDLRIEAANKVADEIHNDGGLAIGVAANVLEKSSLENARKEVNEKLGTCDILINGAGGNHPLGTTSNPFLQEQDIQNKEDGFKTFFDLDPDGIKFVFDLNFIGTLLPTQVFAKDMVGKVGCSILNISSMNAFTPLTKILAYSGVKAAVLIFTPIFLPVVTTLGMDPVHFGIVIVLNLCIGICTPPVGTLLFVGSDVAKVSVTQVIKPLLPFLAIMVAVLMLITYFEDISMFLPRLFGL